MARAGDETDRKLEERKKGSRAAEGRHGGGTVESDRERVRGVAEKKEQRDSRNGRVKSDGYKGGIEEKEVEELSLGGNRPLLRRKALALVSGKIQFSRRTISRPVRVDSRVSNNACRAANTATAGRICPANLFSLINNRITPNRRQPIGLDLNHGCTPFSSAPRAPFKRVPPPFDRAAAVPESLLISHNPADVN